MMSKKFYLRGGSFLCLMLCLVCWMFPAGAEEPDGFFDRVEADSIGKIFRNYDSPTLKYTAESFTMDHAKCYLVRLWVKEPERQIRKATADWKKNRQYPVNMAKQIPEAALVINGSGYVSPQYPQIPENYPGESEDYFYTPLGSLTITDGELFRNMEEIAYYGLTLDADGLQMYTGADNKAVLETNPVQTWSFYDTCPMLRDNVDLLPEEWKFADRKAARTIIGRLDRNNYLVLSIKNGLTLRRALRFFQENFQAEWVYNLDGGPSSALFLRDRGTRRLTLIAGGEAKDIDIMAFTE